jgi:Holliday junction resolvase YEN1
MYHVNSNPIPSPQNADDRDLVQVYTEESLLAHDPLRHSIAGIFFVAVASGADYNPVSSSALIFENFTFAHSDIQAGLPNCGFDTAYAIASTEHTRSLWHGLHDLQSNVAELSAFLKSWRDMLRNELHSNQHGFLTCRRPALADNILDTFPDPHILKLYAFPAISDGSVNTSKQSAWSCPYLTLPKTGMLTRLMCRFNWSWEKTLATLTKHVWTGHFTPQLIDVCHNLVF